MKHFVVLSLFFLTASLTGQVEHPPTVAHCQAHQRLWMSKVEASDYTDYLPGWDTISQWASEMEECQTADPNNHAAYYNLRAKILVLKSVRQQHFIVRHDLYDQFIAEDAAGKR
jgi:hypothetical protein